MIKNPPFSFYTSFASEANRWLARQLWQYEKKREAVAGQPWVSEQS